MFVSIKLFGTLGSELIATALTTVVALIDIGAETVIEELLGVVPSLV